MLFRTPEQVSYLFAGLVQNQQQGGLGCVFAGQGLEQQQQEQEQPQGQEQQEQTPHPQAVPAYRHAGAPPVVIILFIIILFTYLLTKIGI